MNNKIFIALVVLAAGVLVGWYMTKGSSVTPLGQAVPTPTQATSNLGEPEEGTAGAQTVGKGGLAVRTVVVYSENGFAPSTVTVKKGSIVSFVNESPGPMWVASDPHPMHSIYPAFDAKKGYAKGETYEFTFDKVGTWTYHNHLNARMKGTVVVTE